MSDEPGWIFWIAQHDGRIRNFTVGEENEDAAKLAIQTADPSVTFLNFVSKLRAPADLIKKLKLTGPLQWAVATLRRPPVTLRGLALCRRLPSRPARPSTETTPSTRFR